MHHKSTAVPYVVIWLKPTVICCLVTPIVGGLLAQPVLYRMHVEGALVSKSLQPMQGTTTHSTAGMQTIMGHTVYVFGLGPPCPHPGSGRHVSLPTFPAVHLTTAPARPTIPCPQDRSHGPPKRPHCTQRPHRHTLWVHAQESETTATPGNHPAIVPALFRHVHR